MAKPTDPGTVAMVLLEYGVGIRVRDIAKTYGVSVMTVCRIVKRSGVPRRRDVGEQSPHWQPAYHPSRG